MVHVLFLLYACGLVRTWYAWYSSGTHLVRTAYHVHAYHAYQKWNAWYASVRTEQFADECAHLVLRAAGVLGPAGLVTVLCSVTVLRSSLESGI